MIPNEALDCCISFYQCILYPYKEGGDTAWSVTKTCEKEICTKKYTCFVVVVFVFVVCVYLGHSVLRPDPAWSQDTPVYP